MSEGTDQRDLTTMSSNPRSNVLIIVWERRHTLIAGVSLLCIIAYLVMRFALQFSEHQAHWILMVALVIGGIPLVVELAARVMRGQFGSDLLAGISIVTAVLLGEYLAGAIVVLMLSGGESLESFAVRKASSVLDALAKRMPSVAHKTTKAGLVDIKLNEISIGDILQVLPHEICPVDGVVVEGHGSMDEAYLTGEPFQSSKSIGSEVLSGAINGEVALAISAVRLAVDSRYARIMKVMEGSQQQKPQLRRLGDRLGAFYTPLAIAIASLAWLLSGEVTRFLAVIVIATPCPLLIAIPVAIIGSISLAAGRSIIIRDPAILERIGGCQTMIFDKTGTLTYGEPTLTDQYVLPSFDKNELLRLTASLEQYSRHPLATAIVAAGRKEPSPLHAADVVRERAGEGLVGTVDGKVIRVTSAKKLLAEQPQVASDLPKSSGGLECVILVDNRYAATYRFRDVPRPDGAAFVRHLGSKHHVNRIMLLSGDRLSEVQYLADCMGITEILASKSPEEKLVIVREETGRADTVYVGDGINDAPALVAATVGIAMGQRSEVTTEAADAVVMDNKLCRVDELIHIGRRMRRIALQSAVGGMAVSVVGMILAARGYLPPVMGAISQEVLDVVAVLNALRAAWPPKTLSDYTV